MKGKDLSLEWKEIMKLEWKITDIRYKDYRLV